VWLFLASSLLLMIALRVPSILTHREASRYSTGDSAGHVGLWREVRKVGVAAVGPNRQFMFDGPGYPLGFHWLLGILFRSEKDLFRFGVFVPLVCDISLLLFAAVVGNYVGVSHWEWLLLVSVSPSLWANLGRASHISERAFGSLFGNVYLVSVVLAIAHGGLLPWIGVLLGMAVISVSSKFGIQSLLFYSSMASLLLLDWRPLAILAGAWFLSNALLLGYPWKVLKGAWTYSWFYFSELMRRNPESSRNYYLELLAFPQSNSTKKLKSNWVVRAATDSPLHLLLVMIFVGGIGSGNGWRELALAGLVLSLVIAIPGLTFLGESYRYLEFSIVAAFLAVASGLDNFLLFFLLFTVFLALTIKVSVIDVIRRSRASTGNSDEFAALGDFFAPMSRQTVVSAPGRISIYLSTRNESLTFPWMFSGVASGAAREKFLKLLSPEYPYPIMDIPKIQTIVPFDILVVDRDEAPRWAEYAENFGSDNLMYFTKRFIVIHVGPASE